MTVEKDDEIKIVSMYEEGIPAIKIAGEFQVSPATIYPE